MNRRTRIPVKASASNPSRTLVFPSSSMSSTNGDVDEVQKYCTEGTPSWMSKSNSHTNLSVLTIDDLKEEESDDSDDQDAEDLLQGCIKQAWPAKNPVQKPLNRNNSSLGQRIGGEGIPTTQANRSLGGITTIPCPTPAASTPHRHGKGIACSTTVNSGASSKPRFVIPIRNESGF